MDDLSTPEIGVLWYVVQLGDIRVVGNTWGWSEPSFSSFSFPLFLLKEISVLYNVLKDYPTIVGIGVTRVNYMFLPFKSFVYVRIQCSLVW